MSGKLIKFISVYFRMNVCFKYCLLHKCIEYILIVAELGNCVYFKHFKDTKPHIA